ncbi:hypothetical protein L195_g055724 [Trifolium pratense]|uniref:Uncharacterized protein n=1 Tax=Trifolium pratense TaxID=57577 RepID=A0A2K3KMY8_TRIPR|nr:hypothetical protein L195_g055724 [Trifolium pratense]
MGFLGDLEWKSQVLSLPDKRPSLSKLVANSSTRAGVPLVWFARPSLSEQLATARHCSP